ncbi:protein starmaker isoform X2 [Zea mays]|uniref:Uncharacterized protein n=1 Tax=Zea mays TaxID=4577 RepID=A0A1D6HGT0_MAIZE|nr:protein starmaker isoform X2 [Zea mays]AQK73806.1 hypothetical protein ZEAMMB73_Zm00001d017718 [Zea mays]|eukprot:XP_008646116.1 protein starmaker isoform X2 [Zea mays]
MEAAAMDFHTLSRRELQALCKRNGLRANMTNAAMAEALQGLTSVDGIDEIGTSLCLPTPGRSAMKSAAKMVAVAVEEQQHGSPLPRGRRVSVKPPEAIRMEVEEGEDEMKEIVKTPGVALRSTRRGTRATPAPLPTPVAACSTRATAGRTAARKTRDVAPTPATRRSQRTASRKAAGAVEVDRRAEDVSEEKTSDMTIALDQEAEVLAAASKEEKVQQDEKKDVKCDDPKEEDKVQQEEPKDVASDVKIDDPEQEEVANKDEESEEGDEDVSVKSCNDPKVDEVVVVIGEQSTKSHDGIVKEQEPISVEKSAHLTVMEDSTILGVIEDLAELSPAREMPDEIIPVTEDNEVAINEETIKEDDFADAIQTDPTPKEINLTAAGEDKIIEGKEGADDKMPQAAETSEHDEDTEFKEGAADEVLQAELADNETSDGEDDRTEVREGAAAKTLQGELTDDETSEDDLHEDEEWASDDEETASSDESDEGTESNEGSYIADAVQMLQGTGIVEVADEDASTEDDFSGDLPPEFDNIMIFRDAETDSDSVPPALEENQAVAFATKAAESLGDSAMNAEHYEGPEEADATEKTMKVVEDIVKSLDESSFKEGESKETQKKQPQDYDIMSLIKLRSTYKKCLIARKEGKRPPLEEVDGNACIDH